MRYGSVCSGIEAASVAWRPLGWECAFVSEIDKFPAAVLKERFPEVPNLGDFSKIERGDYKGDIDLLVGGTPCQAFSIAGLRKGLKDERGNLALEFAKLAFRAHAKYVVWENVPGVLSSGKGRDFASFLSLLVGWEVKVPEDGKWRKAGLVTAAPGCFNVGWRVLDAQYTRVQQFPRAIPQRRRRVILVGSLGPWSDCEKILFDGEMCGGDAPPRREAREASPGDAGEGAQGAGWRFSWWDGGQRASTLTTRSIGQLMPDKQQLPCVIDTRWHDYAVDGACLSLLASDFKEPKAVCDPCPTIDASYPGKMNNQDVGKLDCYENHGQDTRIRDCGDVSPSIPAQAGTGGNNLPLVQKVFVLDSMASNAMKSKNPQSGCHETEVATTLDTTNPSPSKHQGGMAVVEAVSIAEKVIGRKEKNTGNGIGAKEGVCYTLDTVAVHGVCYPIDMTNVDGREKHPFGKAYDAPGTAAYSLTSRRPSGVCLPGVIRRLLPVECERLMGFPDDWTLIPWRGKPKEQCPDGPRYKALGNSMCTNVMAWIGERIDALVKEKGDGR